MCSGSNKIDFRELFSNPGKMVVIFGKSGSGKSTIIKSILHKCNDLFTHAYVIQGSEPSTDNVYINVVWPDDITVVNTKDKKSIESAKTEMLQNINKLRDLNLIIEDSNKKSNKNIIKPMHAVYIFDDLTSYTKHFGDLQGKLRHTPTTMIFLLHSVVDIDKTFRSNINCYMININFELSQLGQTFPKLNEDFNLLKSKHGKNNRLFCVYNVDMNNSSYVYIEPDELEELKKTGYSIVFHKSSKQRSCLRKMLMELVDK